MKQVRIFLVAVVFLAISILLSSRYEANSDTDTSAADAQKEQGSGHDYSLRLNYDFSSYKPYLQGTFSDEADRTNIGGQGKTDGGCLGCSCDLVIPARNDFYLVDGAGPLRVPSYGNSSYDKDYMYPKDVNDLVLDYFEGEIGYDQLEDELDDLGWGLDSMWGPYPYESLLEMRGCDGFYIGGYGSRPRPQTDGIQFDQFRLINPRISND